MDTTPCVATILGVVVLASCTTPEQAAGLTGVSETDALEISRVIHEQTSQQILSYRRQPDGTVFVEVRSRTSEPDIYLAAKGHGKWSASDQLMLVHRTD